jgi:hypothetical protein
VGQLNATDPVGLVVGTVAATPLQFSVAITRRPRERVPYGAGRYRPVPRHPSQHGAT